MIHVGINPGDLKRLADKFGATAREMEKAIVGATNDVAKAGVAQTRKRVRAYLNLAGSSINRRITVDKRASAADPTALITLDSARHGSTRRPTLKSFGGRPTRPYYESAAHVRNRARPRGQRRKLKPPPPFTYQIIKSGTRKTLPTAFVARTTRRFNAGVYTALDPGSGNVQAFRRIPGQRGIHGQKLGVPRGPSIAAVWQNKPTGVQADSIESIRGDFTKKIEGRLHAVFNKKFRKTG